MLSLLSSLLIAACLMSSTGLVVSLWGVHWLGIFLVNAGVLAALGATHTIARAVAIAAGERISLRAAGIVRVLSLLFRPALLLQERVVLRMVPQSRRENNGNGDSAQPQVMLPLRANGEPLEEFEWKMIRGVIELDDTTAREIMVPRLDMVTVALGTPISEVAATMVRSGHSRLPVYEEDLDHVQGMVYGRDILSVLSKANGKPAMLTRDLIRKALFIPESKTLEELLEEFQNRRVHIAVVVDEYGGVSGLVTIEDLLEEIVGDIQDEFDPVEQEVEQVSENEYLMDARTSIDEVEDLLRVEVDGDGFDTVGGLVFDRLGKIPTEGDVVD